MRYPVDKNIKISQGHHQGKALYFGYTSLFPGAGSTQPIYAVDDATVYSVENQPIILAKRLLSEGMSIDEVIAKTNLPSYEVSMLAKVHNLQARPKSIEEQAHQMTEQYQSAQVNTTSAVEDPLAQAVEQNEETQAFARKMQPTHHVANLKARDAYGIGSKSILRRPR